MADIPIIEGAITYAGANITDNITAIAGITLILIVSMIFKPFDQANSFAMMMCGISAIAALAGYEVGKRTSVQT